MICYVNKEVQDGNTVPQLSPANHITSQLAQPDQLIA